MEPRYNVPNRATFRDQIIPTWHSAEKAKLYHELILVRHVGLTGDCWTSRATDPYLTTTVHFVRNFEMKTKVLGTQLLQGSHTGENLSTELDSGLISWNIQDKTEAMTVDNAANIHKAIQISGIPRKIPCFAHTLSLASTKADDCARKVLSRIRPCVAFFHRSHVANQVLKEKQKALNIKEHNLVIDCKTRWNSTYLMVTRYLEQRIAILATLSDDRLSGKESKSFKADLMEDKQICQLEEYTVVMEPMYKVKSIENNNLKSISI